jgi:hypothetical protein
LGKHEGRSADHVMLLDAPLGSVTKVTVLSLTREWLLYPNPLIGTNRLIIRIAFSVAHFLCKVKWRRDGERLAVEVKRLRDSIMGFLISS